MHMEYNPELSKHIESLRLDKIVCKSSGKYLFLDNGTKVLDFVAQAGCVPFGHNPDVLTKTIREHLDNELPSFTSPLYTNITRELAKALFKHTLYEYDRCIFTNSGAEATEAAIKIARAKTKKQIIVSATNGFHGKTLGALSATHNKSYQEPFLLDTTAFVEVPYNDLDKLEVELKKNHCAALFLEPLQGEAGMIMPGDSYLREAQQLCSKYGVLFVLDEIQTGLGRTGSFLAAHHFDVEPDVLLLGKALGGGMMPLGACLLKSTNWTAEIALKHSSTFANNSLVHAVALQTVNTLAENDSSIVKRVKQLGSYLKSSVEDVINCYPSVYSKVSGLGLMQAIHVRKQGSHNGYLLDYIGAPLITSYLLNEKNILTMLALNNSKCLRLEPPFSITNDDIDQLADGLRGFGDLVLSENLSDWFKTLTAAK